MTEALAEVEEGVDFYLAEADFEPGPALRFQEALADAIDEVRESPGRWPLVDEVPNVRRCPLSSPYQDWAVVFTLEGATVVVLAVPHGSRRPGYWRSRRPNK